MVSSKWKITKYLLPIIALIAIGIIAKSWSPQIIQGKDSIIQSDKTDQDTKEINEKLIAEEDIESTHTNQSYTHCDSIYKTLLPIDQDYKQLIDFIIDNSIKSDSSGSITRLFKSLRNLDDERLSIEQPLQGIYNLKNQKTSIISYIKYKDIDGTYMMNSAEIDLIKKYHSAIDTFPINNKVYLFDNVLKSEFKENIPTLYTFSDKEKKVHSLNSIGFYLNECLEYTSYTFEDNDSTLLMSSTFNLDLEFGTFPKTDALLDHISLEDCRDCPDGLENMKTFAQLKGAENIYFTYSRYEIKNKSTHLPSRALIFINDKEQVHFLWINEVDLFGCACL